LKKYREKGLGLVSALSRLQKFKDKHPAKRINDFIDNGDHERDSQEEKEKRFNKFIGMVG
jgi:hypothetical protein